MRTQFPGLSKDACCRCDRVGIAGVMPACSQNLDAIGRASQLRHLSELRNRAGSRNGQLKGSIHRPPSRPSKPIQTLTTEAGPWMRRSSRAQTCAPCSTHRPLEGAVALESRAPVSRANFPPRRRCRSTPEGPAHHAEIQQVAIAGEADRQRGGCGTACGETNTPPCSTRLTSRPHRTADSSGLARTLPGPCRARFGCSACQWLQIISPVRGLGVSPSQISASKLLAAVAVAPPNSASALAAAFGQAGPQTRAKRRWGGNKCWAQHSPRDAARWVSQFPDTLSRNTAEQNLVTLWTTQDAPGAANWLNQLPAGTLRNVGVAAYTQALARGIETQLDP
jgi:hypothetical protein